MVLYSSTVFIRYAFQTLLIVSFQDGRTNEFPMRGDSPYGNETWVAYITPESKQQSTELWHSDSSREVNFK